MWFAMFLIPASPILAFLYNAKWPASLRAYQGGPVISRHLLLGAGASCPRLLLAIIAWVDGLLLSYSVSWVFSKRSCFISILTMMA
jgi:hypothetical protein